MTRGPIYTIGHSTRPAERFLEILGTFGITTLADIRTVPRSRRNPQYDQSALRGLLEERHISYLHMKGLGGLRRPRADSPNLGWENLSFRGYADYMQTGEFVQALDDLIAIAGATRTVVMCAEAVPWRCHRSLVGDALLIRGFDVLDILSEKSAKPHTLTPWAQVTGLQIVYPRMPETSAAAPESSK
ncbi:MAG: DUF488 domain-containing protein [Acidobacteriaceae bacterium]|nr:DUF488 domain-containing protein [Acidobacteriaceae bacterium]